MRNALLTVALVLVSCAPGCITSELWEWAREDDVDTFGATAIEEVARAPDGGFVVHLRMADGSPRTQQWLGEDLHGPAMAYAEACREANSRTFQDDAVGSLQKAVRRGLLRRDFTTDPPLAPIAERPEVVRLVDEPVRLPELILREGESSSGWVSIVLLAPPEPPASIIEVEPVSVDVSRGGPLGYVAAVLATPVTFVVDVVTFPVQVLIVVWAVGSLLNFD